MSSPHEAFVRILEVLDLLEIEYLVGGSLASSAHGIPRATRDVDFIVQLHANHVDEFARLLGTDFYVDGQTIRDALALGRSFNVIHFATSYKFDFFPAGTDPFKRTELQRRMFVESAPLGGEPVEWALATAEDTILSKLAWFRAGGETSERQWNDLRGVLRISGPRLDREYLAAWAARLGVADLWQRLLSELPSPCGAGY